KDVALEAESAADVWPDHPELLLGEVHQLGDPSADQMRGLRRRPQGDVAVGVQRRERRTAFHRHCAMAVGAGSFAQYERGAGKGAIDVSTSAGELHDDVVSELLVDERSTRLEGRFRIDRTGKNVVVDVNELCRVLCDVARFGEHGGDGLAYVPNLPDGEARQFKLLEERRRGDGWSQ